MCNITVVVIVKRVYFKSDPCIIDKYGIRYYLTIQFITRVYIIQKTEYFS